MKKTKIESIKQLERWLKKLSTKERKALKWSKTYLVEVRFDGKANQSSKNSGC